MSRRLPPEELGMFWRLLGWLVVCAVLAVPFYWYRYRQCVNFAEMNGWAHRWVWFDGCYVQRDGEWFPRDQVRSVD